MKKEDQVIVRIIQIIGDEILKRSLENLSSKEFALREINANEIGVSGGRTKKPHRWTITNTSVLAKTGYKQLDRANMKMEVGFSAPYANYVDKGSSPGAIPFEPLYDWAWKRKEEIMQAFGKDIIIPRNNRLYQDMKRRYIFDNDKGKKRVKSRADKFDKGEVLSFDTDREYREKIFAFAFWVWKDIANNGVDPTFFASDAVWSVMQDLPRLLKEGIKMEGVRVE